MLYFAICAKSRIETSRTVSRRSMSVSFLLFYRALSRQSPLFRSARVHHSIDLLSAWERARKRRRWRRRRQRRRFSRMNRDTTRERGCAERRNGEISRSGEWNAYWISRKRGEGMSMAVRYLSSVAVAAADADRVGAGNGISASRSRWCPARSSPSQILNVVTRNNRPWWTHKECRWPGDALKQDTIAWPLPWLRWSLFRTCNTLHLSLKIDLQL